MVSSINPGISPIIANLGDNPDNAPEQLQNATIALEAFLAQMQKDGNTSPEDYTTDEKKILNNLMANVQTELNAVVAGANAGDQKCITAITENQSFMQLFGQYTVGADGKYTTADITTLDLYLSDASTSAGPGYNQDLVDICSDMGSAAFLELLNQMATAHFTS